jgi:hypothetical protein
MLMPGRRREQGRAVDSIEAPPAGGPPDDVDIGKDGLDDLKRNRLCVSQCAGALAAFSHFVAYGRP